MFEVKQRCQVVDCHRAASTHCFCCNKNVCTRHFTEHIDAVKAQIDPLANDINSMVEQIQTLTIEQITESSFAQLHQWRDDMHKSIDDIFLAKSKEMEDLIEKNTAQFLEHKNEQSETMMKVQDDARQLVEDGDATHEQIQLLRKRLSDVETKLTTFGKDFICISTRLLTKSLVTVSSNLNKSMPIFNNAPPALPVPMEVANADARYRRKHAAAANIASPTPQFNAAPVFAQQRGIFCAKPLPQGHSPLGGQPVVSLFGNPNNQALRSPSPFSFGSFGQGQK